MRKLADDKAGEYLVGRSETKRLQGCAVIEREETHAEEKEKSNWRTIQNASSINAFWLSRAVRQPRSLWTRSWSVPCEAMERKVPPTSPPASVYGVARNSITPRPEELCSTANLFTPS